MKVGIKLTNKKCHILVVSKFIFLGIEYDTTDNTSNIPRHKAEAYKNQKTKAYKGIQGIHNHKIYLKHRL